MTENNLQNNCKFKSKELSYTIKFWNYHETYDHYYKDHYCATTNFSRFASTEGTSTHMSKLLR